MSISEFTTVKTKVPTHWVSKYHLDEKDVTFELLKVLGEYEEIDGYYLADVIVNSDKIFAFKIDSILHMNPLDPHGSVIVDGYLDVIYITSDFTIWEARISRYSDKSCYDWDVTQEIAKHLGLSPEEWKEEGKIEEIVGKMEQKCTI
jgi:hypothetical protein